MNAEQREYIGIINQSAEDVILIKKTGWEEVNLPGHVHGKCQIIYTLAGTLHVEIGSESYFVPEKHIAWIPQGAEHKLSSNSRQVSMVIFYVSLRPEGKDDPKGEFAIYTANRLIGENLKFIASKGKMIGKQEQPDLYHFALGFFNLLPQMSPGKELLLKSLVIPDDSRLYPVLRYLTDHVQEELRMDEVALRYNLSTRNLSRLFQESNIHFSSYVNRLRIMRAIELMTDGGRTMQEIAYAVGFNNPNHFNRVFRQVTGQSPKNYLRSCQEDETV